MKIKGNRGEWSELYVMLKLLADGKLYSTDTNLTKDESLYSPLLKVFRSETDTEELVFQTSNNGKKKEIILYVNDDRIKVISAEWFKTNAEELYLKIKEHKGGPAFAIPSTEKAMGEIHCTKIKAKSDDKTDIKLEIHDVSTGRDSICGYSIKSYIGAKPTLLNPSSHTNFIFEISGLNTQDIDEINSIMTKKGKADILARIKRVLSKGGTIGFNGVDSTVFLHNMSYVDSMMDDILGAIVYQYYVNNTANVTDIVTHIEEEDPLGYNISGIYRYKMKKFLCAVALGMTPGKPWDGRDEANGGYIVAKDNGDVVAFHIYDRDTFETYLLNNTKLERASTSRYKYASIYQEDGKMYIKLNLQIRFI